MSVTPSSHVVGIFSDRSAAEQAVEALYNAGFEHEQVHYASPGGFLDDLKSIFTGANANATNLANDLVTMGLSDEEVQYYTNAYNNGNSILAVNAAGREQDISDILDQYGAYGTAVKPHYHRGATNPLEQPPSYASSDADASSEQHTIEQQPAYVEPELDAADPAEPASLEQAMTYETAHGAQDTPATSSYETTDQPAAHESQDTPVASSYEATDHPAEYEPQQDTPMASSYETTDHLAADEPQHTPATSSYETTDHPVADEPQDTPAVSSYEAVDQTTVYEPQDSVATGDYGTTDQSVQATQDAADTSEAEAEQPVTTTSSTDTHEYAALDQPEQQTSEETPIEAQTVAPVVASEETDHQAAPVEEYVPPQEAATPVATSDAATPVSASKLETLLQQVQTMRQQLEETKARLQAAKEHEAQIQTVRQQMHELQKELEAAQAELRDTEARLEQY